MYIPSVQEFKCCANSHDVLTVDISKCDPESVLFQINSCDVYVDSTEQVLMIRDMLTVWLSRNVKEKPEQDLPLEPWGDK